MSKVKKLVAAVTLTLAATGAHASIAQIQMSGLNFNYNEATGEFCDAGGCGDAADPIFTMIFLIDDELQGMYTTNIGWNLFLSITPGTDPTEDGEHDILEDILDPDNDFFDAEINSAPGLFTNVTSGSVVFSNNVVNATGSGFSTIFAQALPFGLQASDPINWSFSSGVGSCTGDQVGSRICTYSGTGEMSWTQVPEPGTLLLMGGGLLAFGAAARRRRTS